MQHKTAFILSQATLERFNVSSLKQLLKVTELQYTKDGWENGGYYNAVSFAELTKGIDRNFQIIDKADMKPLEIIALSVLRQATQSFAHIEGNDNEVRRLVVGKANGRDDRGWVLGWTDGKTYIAPKCCIR